jgi:hypothetical protein
MSLRTAAIRLAHENPGPVRAAILPILKLSGVGKGDEVEWREKGVSFKGRVTDTKGVFPGEYTVKISEMDGKPAGRVIGISTFVDKKDLRVVNLTASMKRTAGEVRHVKDRAGDEKNFAWADHGPSEREMAVAFEFDPSKLKPLAKCLRATLMALGHSQSAYHDFTKLKSAVISPDGNLGGKGYIQRIAEMRRMYMNVSEALSSLSDTIYDEINAAHWNPVASEEDPRERDDVAEIMDDVDELREDPEGFAEEVEEDMDGHGKTAAWGDEHPRQRNEFQLAKKWTQEAMDSMNSAWRSLHGVDKDLYKSARNTATQIHDFQGELTEWDEKGGMERLAWTGADPDMDDAEKHKQVEKILKALDQLSHHKIKPRVETDSDGWSMIKINVDASLAAAYIEQHLNEHLGSRAPFTVEHAQSQVYIIVGEDERNRRASVRRVVARAVTAAFVFPEPDDLKKYLLEDAVEIEGFGGLLPNDETVEEGLDQRFENLLENWENDIRGLVKQYPRVRKDVAEAFVRKFPQYAGQRSR